MIVLSASTELAAFEMRRLKEKLDQLDPAPQVAYGGSAFDNNPKVIEMVPGHYIGRTFEEGLETIKELLKEKELA
jgi:hypothetical protein